MQIIVIALAAAAAVVAGFFSVSSASHGLFMAVGCVVAVIIAFFSPKLSLVLLVFSMMLSPEIGLGVISSSRSAVLRYDDILLIVIFLSWFGRTAIFKDKPFISSTPPQVPVLTYIVIAVVSTSLGILRGDIRAEVAVFYVLKYVEYFLLYFMVVNVLDSKEEVKKYLKYAGWVAFLVTVYAYFYYLNSGPDARASAPFEAPLGNPKESEPASLGGYYLIVFSFVLAFMTETQGRGLLLAAAGMAFMFPAFLLTFSRASYIGLGAMLPALLLLARRRKVFLAFFMAAGLSALFLFPGLSGKVSDRVTMTYQGEYAVNTFKISGTGELRLEDSAAARVLSLKNAIFKRLPEHPLLGWGVTGIGMGDTQYALLLGEMGLAGLFVFFWMMYRIFFMARAVFRAYGEPWIKALAMGLMCAIFALLFQGLGVNTFIVVRIMEPFWFLTAIVAFFYSRIQAERAADAPIAEAA